MIVTAEELARQLGVSGKTFRAWLRKEVRRGNPIVRGHVHNEPWEFTADEAAQLALEYRTRRRSANPEQGIASALVTTKSSSLKDEAERAAQVLTARPDRDMALPGEPGLYVIWALSSEAVRDLGLRDFNGEQPLTERPLYLGNAEDSIGNRVLGTHFATGKTGHSTVRRTFAALLGLRSCPRATKVAEPTAIQTRTSSANYGLIPEDDEFLAAWMEENLAVGVFTTGCQPLKDLSALVLS